jgi:N-acetylglucosaminyldiphosphoundecaprenol N-acetyl-beta-D-mannosaminyltransferase
MEVGDRDYLFEKCKSLVGRGGIVFTPNPLILSSSVENASLRRALLSADLCIPDGSGLLPYLKSVDRRAAVLPGVELGRMLVESRGGLSLGLIGGKEGIAARAFSALSARAEQLRPAFLLNGYDTPLTALLSSLRDTKPDLCFVCLGSPRQELLMPSLRAYSKETLFLGLGGSLDVYAGYIQRAPAAFRALHMEWLYRMIREPHRFHALPKLIAFPFLCARYREENNKLTKNGVMRTKN